MSIEIYRSARIRTSVERIIPQLRMHQEALIPKAQNKLKVAVLAAMTELAFSVADNERLERLNPKNSELPDINIRTADEFWIWALQECASLESVE